MIDSFVKLKNGNIAQIVEVFGGGQAYAAEVETPDGEVSFENIYPADIVEVMKSNFMSVSAQLRVAEA